MIRIEVQAVGVPGREPTRFDLVLQVDNGFLGYFKDKDTADKACLEINKAVYSIMDTYKNENISITE